MGEYMSQARHIFARLTVERTMDHRRATGRSLIHKLDSNVALRD